MSTASSTAHPRRSAARAADDQARAERVAAAAPAPRRAAESRHPRRVAGDLPGALADRGANVDPVLFTTPAKVAVAAVGMIASGELWPSCGRAWSCC